MINESVVVMMKGVRGIGGVHIVYFLQLILLPNVYQDVTVYCCRGLNPRYSF